MNNLLPHGWQVIGKLGEDGSTRRYTRVRKNHIDAILMECYGDTPGHRIEDFIRISQWLNSIGLKAPDIYEGSATERYLIIEDFGDVSFKTALQAGDAKKLYGLASDVLTHLQKQSCPLDLPDYYQSHVHTGRRRIIDWYVPALRRAKNPDGLAEEYLDVWAKIESGLPPCPQGFLHIDFHVENLMYLPGEAGLRQCGILDFQGAMRGPLPYDLGNLLEDARIDVPEDIRQGILQDYDADFRRWYRVVTTQFHCRVIGQFIRLAVKDGKTVYLQYIPRTAFYLRKALQDPLLKPLQSWFDAQNIDFETLPDLRNIKDFIRPDAF